MEVKGFANAKVVESYEFYKGQEIPDGLVERTKSIMFLMKQNETISGSFDDGFVAACRFRLFRHEDYTGFQVNIYPDTWCIPSRID